MVVLVVELVVVGGGVVVVLVVVLDVVVVLVVVVPQLVHFTSHVSWPGPLGASHRQPETPRQPLTASTQPPCVHWNLQSPEQLVVVVVEVVLVV